MYDHGYGSGLWIACGSRVWIEVLHFEARPHMYLYIYIYVTSKSAHNISDITISHGFPTNLKIPPKHCFGRFVYSVLLAFMCSQKFDSDPLTLTVGFPRPVSKASKLRPGATEDTSCDETHVGHWNLT